MPSLFLALFAALLFTISDVNAEEILTLAEKTGKWSFSMSEAGADLKTVSKEKQKKIRDALQEITGFVTATAAMSPPKGFEARFWGSMAARDRYDACKGSKCPPVRPAATLAMMLGRYEESNGRIKAAFNTPSTMDISINNLGHVFAHLPVLYKDADGYLLPEPQLDGERAGMRTYLNQGHAIAVMTANDKPLWLPVSRERYLKAAIEAVIGAEAGPQPAGKGKKKQATEVSVISGKPVLIEESRSWVDPADEKKWVESSRSLVFEMKQSVEDLKKRAQKLQSELAAMTPEELAMPAKVAIATAADGEIPSLLPGDSTAGVPVVTPDFRYFNPKLPPEAVQLIVVQWKFDANLLYDPQRSGITENLNNQKLLEIYRSMDWQKLRDKVIRTGP